MRKIPNKGTLASFLFISIIYMMTGYTVSNGDFSTPGTGVFWRMDDLVANSEGTVTGANGTYHFNGTVIVYMSDTLWINAGDSLIFNRLYRLDAYHGYIYAIGTETDSIIFTSKNDSSGSWEGINIIIGDYMPMGDIQLSYCIIEYPNYGLRSFYYGEADIDHSTIRNCLYHGVSCIDGGAGIRDCIITDNDVGVFVEAEWGGFGFGRCGIYNSEIVGNKIGITCRGYETGEFKYLSLRVNNTKIIENDSTGILIDTSFDTGFWINLGWLSADDEWSKNEGKNQIFGNGGSFDIINYGSLTFSDAQRTGIPAENCWWGTTDSIDIDRRIYDDEEDSTSAAIDFMPVLLYDPTIKYRGGDVNRDGEVDVLDVLSIVNHILRIDLLIDDAICLADCNADGHIDVLDVVGVVHVILGIRECQH